MAKKDKAEEKKAETPKTPKDKAEEKKAETPKTPKNKTKKKKAETPKTPKVERDFGVVRVYTPATVEVPVEGGDEGETAPIEVLVPVSNPLKKKAQGEQWVVDNGANDTPYVVVRELRTLQKKTVSTVQLV